MTDSFRVTVYDLRGHGLSEVPPRHYTTADMADDLAGLLDALGIDGAHIVGHSFGGGVALQFAALHPERVTSVTVADSRVRALQPSQRFAGMPIEHLWRNGPARAGMTSDVDPELGHRSLTAFARGDGRSGPPEANLGDYTPFRRRGVGRRSAERWMRLLETTTARADFRAVAGLTLARIRNIDRPARAIYGQRSFCLQSGRALRVALPHCRLVVVPNGGHFHPVVQPADFVRHLRDFLIAPC
jgi:pimeloyl-ACP methyl ester carboxylesterase